MSLELTPRARAARTSPIRSMTAECARVGGINLAQGVCDTPVPELVRRAAQAAIEDGANSYSRSEGLPELRRALAAKMRRDDRLDYDPDSEIVVTSGATGAFYVVCQALLQPGDEVILFEPYYGYHRNTLEALGVVPRYVTLRGPDFALPLGELEIALSSRTRAIVVNTPGNPSGKVCTRAELEALGAIARERDVFLLTDEVYEHFVYDGREHVSPASLPGLRERTITMNALSKTFAVTGWRIGWVAAPRRFAEAFTHLHDLVYVCAPTPLQLACAIGLERLGPEYYAAISVEYQRKRDQLCEALAAARLAPLRPQGSYFALADISRMPGANGDERALALLRECGVACVPGTAFWRDGDAHRLGRFCFGKTDADLAEACRRLRNLQV
ncbi:MAG: pyridoxal phosphate-dependent aminotransferase [Deltaproteobacteria bacterium]|nr:pyridoxal phosphate-dependent aminotransferase [Deltaproteobacteria bacterium]